MHLPCTCALLCICVSDHICECASTHSLTALPYRYMWSHSCMLPQLLSYTAPFSCCATTRPENILLFNRGGQCEHLVAKLTDFGGASMEPRMRIKYGSPSYSAPEIHRASRCGTTGEGYTNAIDCWSVGVVVFFCLSGRLPFNTAMRIKPCNNMREHVTMGKFRFFKSRFVGVTEDAKGLIRRLLAPAAAQRLTAEGALAQPWFGGAFEHSTASKGNSGAALGDGTGDQQQEPHSDSESEMAHNRANWLKENVVLSATADFAATRHQQPQPTSIRTSSLLALQSASAVSTRPSTAHHHTAAHASHTPTQPATTIHATTIPLRSQSPHQSLHQSPHQSPPQSLTHAMLDMPEARRCIIDTGTDTPPLSPSPSPSMGLAVMVASVTSLTTTATAATSAAKERSPSTPDQPSGLDFGTAPLFDFTEPIDPVFVRHYQNYRNVHRDSARLGRSNDVHPVKCNHKMRKEWAPCLRTKESYALAPTLFCALSTPAGSCHGVHGRGTEPHVAQVGKYRRGRRRFDYVCRVGTTHRVGGTPESKLISRRPWHHIDRQPSDGDSGSGTPGTPPCDGVRAAAEYEGNSTPAAPSATTATAYSPSSPSSSVTLENCAWWRQENASTLHAS